jgi:NTP pyrophosphatase (non-canonical NTP hydrolase)
MIPYNSEIAENSEFPVGDVPTFVTYEQMVTNLMKDWPDRARTLENAAMCISGESGELIDPIKKYTIYGKILDRKNVIEELGDIEFYMAALRQMLGISRYETLAGNVAKLSARYQDGTYSDAAAIDRADKKEPELHVIDVTSTEYKEANKANNPPISDQQVGSVDETADLVTSFSAGNDGTGTVPHIEEWCKPLLQAYHAGKTVVAIGYSAHTATVMFEGDPLPHKLYKPKGEQ